MFISTAGFITASLNKNILFGGISRSLNNCVSAGYIGDFSKVSKGFLKADKDDLDRAIAEDYINNKIVLVNGWIFSTTELDFIKSQLAEEGKFHQFVCSITTQITVTTSSIINWAIIFRRYISTIKNQVWY